MSSTMSVKNFAAKRDSIHVTFQTTTGKKQAPNYLSFLKGLEWAAGRRSIHELSKSVNLWKSWDFDKEIKGCDICKHSSETEFKPERKDCLRNWLKCWAKKPTDFDIHSQKKNIFANMTFRTSEKRRKSSISILRSTNEKEIQFCNLIESKINEIMKKSTNICFTRKSIIGSIVEFFMDEMVSNGSIQFFLLIHFKTFKTTRNLSVLWLKKTFSFLLCYV